MLGRQVLVAVAEVVFAKLAGAIAQWLEQFRNCGIFIAVAQLRPRQPHLGKAGSVDTLARNKGGAAGGATLLGVIMDELRPLLGDPVDVGGFVAHQAIAVAAEVALADVIAPENQHVGLAVGHGSRSWQGNGSQCHFSLGAPNWPWLKETPRGSATTRISHAASDLGDNMSRP